MKLPVKPKDDRDIIDEDGFVCFANTTEDRDHIVKAINCHEKLVEAIKDLYDLYKKKCTGQHVKFQRIVSMHRQVKQALKEAEKPQ